MSDRIWRSIGWAALWIAVIAVGVRVGIDASGAIPDPPPPHGPIFISDLPRDYSLLYAFARDLAFIAPLAVLLTAIHVWRGDARERAGRNRRRVFR